MIDATNKVITDLLAAWHESHKADLSIGESTMDTHYRKTAKQGRKYINLDCGGSGVFMVERSTGEVYQIKAYGQIDKRKHVGNVETLTGQYLLLKRKGVQ